MSHAWLVLATALVGLALHGCGHDAGPAAGHGPSEQRERVLVFWQRLPSATDARLAQDFARARDLYLEALSLDPRHEDSLYYLGHCERHLKQPTQARRSFERLVTVNPSSARGHLALGALLASSDPQEPVDLAAAEAHLRRAHEINGEETGPMLRLGEVLIVKGRREEARTWLEAAARTNPRSVEAPFLLGYLSWEEGDGRGAKAFLGRAARAARIDAPAKGVLGEGDRKATGTAGPARAAPPLREPMGRTLFSEVAKPIRTSDPEAIVAEADSLYRALDEARRALAARRAPSTPAVLTPCPAPALR